MSNQHVLLVGANGSSGAALCDSLTRRAMNVSCVEMCPVDEDRLTTPVAPKGALSIPLAAPASCEEAERAFDRAERKQGPITDLMVLGDFRNFATVRFGDTLAFASIVTSCVLQTMISRGYGHVAIANPDLQKSSGHILDLMGHLTENQRKATSSSVGLTRLMLKGDAETDIQRWLVQRDRVNGQTTQLARPQESSDPDATELGDKCRVISSRRIFDQLIAKETARASRYQRPVCLVRARVDRFERHSAMHGEGFGGAIASQIVKACQLQLRSADTMYVSSQGELDILLPETDVSGSRDVFEKLNGWFSRAHFELGGRRLSFSLTLDSAVVLHNQRNDSSSFSTYEEPGDLMTTFL